MTVITDDLPAQLIRHEHELWEAMRHGDDGSLVERSAAIVALDGTTWGEATMSDQRVVRLGDRAAMLAYRLRSTRDGSPVDVWATTTYVYSEGRWRVGAHQQSPAAD